MTTLTAHRHCVQCACPLAVEIAYAAGFGPAGVEVDVMPQRSNIVEFTCGHAPANLRWLLTHEGTAWCEAQAEDARIEGSLA